MKRLIALLFLSFSLHAAGPVRMAFDAKAVEWNYRCATNNNDPRNICNQTISLLSSSLFMRDVRNAALYPGSIFRANLFCGKSYGGTSGAGNDGSSIKNIGSPQVPLINDTGTSIDVSANFQADWYYQETGAAGGLGVRPGLGGTGCRLETGFVPSTMHVSVDSMHLSYYGMATGTEASIPFGSADAGPTNPNYLTLAYPAFGQSAAAWSDAGRAVDGTSVDQSGFFLGSRNGSAADSLRAYRNGALTATSPLVSGARPASGITVFCLNVNGTFIAPTTNNCGGYTIGSALTAAQQLSLYNAMQGHQTRLQRQK